MTLLETLQMINGQSMHAAQLSDLLIGTVTNASPLEITTDVSQAALRREVLYLTEAVIEKKIDTLKHDHYVLHSHSIPNGSTGATGVCLPALEDVKCYENGRALPTDASSITLNEGLKLGDKVLLLSVQHGQKFVVLSRLF